MAINAEIVPYPYEPIEKALKRFAKKCKKEEIVREFCDRTRFKTKRQRRKEKSLKHQRLRQKHSK